MACSLALRWVATSTPFERPTVSVASGSRSARDSVSQVGDIQNTNAAYSEVRLHCEKETTCQKAARQGLQRPTRSLTTTQPPRKTVMRGFHHSVAVLPLSFHRSR